MIKKIILLSLFLLLIFSSIYFFLNKDYYQNTTVQKIENQELRGAASNWGWAPLKTIKNPGNWHPANWQTDNWQTGRPARDLGLADTTGTHHHRHSTGA